MSQDFFPEKGQKKKKGKKQNKKTLIIGLGWPHKELFTPGSSTYSFLVGLRNQQKYNWKIEAFFSPPVLYK